MTEDDLIGKQLGEYQLEALLGRGGMARVYRAVDTRLKRQAVVKVIDAPFRDDPDYVMRFAREAQAVARLDHPNIVQLYRFDEQDGLLYMAMQHVEGADLEVVMAGYRADHEFMEPEDIRRIIREVCSALDYAHSKGVIHRDVKPANILLNREGHAILTDFGLVLLTEVGTRGEIFGSAHYIAPEQAISSAQAVPQSDLYSVGVILYEMFTGMVPFNADEPLDIALLHMSDPPTPPRDIRPEINPELEAVLLKTLSKQPEQRYPSGLALADALDHSLKVKSALASLATLRHQTIPERVAVQLGKQLPLPPVPAESAASAPTSVDEQTPVADKPKPSSTGKRRLTYVGVAIVLGILGLLTILCLGMFALPSLVNRITQSGIVSADPSSVAEVTQALASPLESTLTESPIQTQATLFASPSNDVLPTTIPATPTPLSFNLLIVRGLGNDSVILINQSIDKFPLRTLQLVGDKNKGVSGMDWDVNNLESEACVGAWKEAGKNANYDLPKGVNCRLVGRKITQKKKDWFGDGAFEVSYNGASFGTCGRDQNQCSITLTP